VWSQQAGSNRTYLWHSCPAQTRMWWSSRDRTVLHWQQEKMPRTKLWLSNFSFKVLTCLITENKCKWPGYRAMNQSELWEPIRAGTHIGPRQHHKANLLYAGGTQWGRLHIWEVHISAQIPSLLIEGFRGFSQSLQMNVWIVPYN
jgi:hypothetical protein